MTATLREMFHDLADQAKTVELAAPALRKAHRMRVRRYALTTAGVVVALGVPFVVLSGPEKVEVGAIPSVVSSTSPGTSPSTAIVDRTPGVNEPVVELPGGWIIGGGSGEDHPWIYDRVTGGYHTVPYHRAIPAPVGELVFVERQNGWAGVLNLRTNQTRQLAPAGSGWALGTPGWSADGRRLLRITDSGKVFVTEAETGTSKEIHPQTTCEQCNSAVWLPGDEQFAYYDSNRPGAQATIHAIADGRLLRTVSWKPGARTAFSPDGTRVVTGDGIVDTATGAVIVPISINDPRVVYWAEPDRILLLKQDGVAVHSADGRRLGTVPWPAEFIDDELPNFTLVKG